ncbi:MAG: HAD family hydrolase, partial [Alcaligenaceae bacterium]
MHPISLWQAAYSDRICGLFTDIDDTLTTDGAITPDAVSALSQLKAAGLHLIPITGRPVG